MSKKRRPSHTSLTARRPSHASQGRRPSYASQTSTTSTVSSTMSDGFLAARTRKSISKSRRGSAVDEKPPSRRTSLAAAISLLSLPSFMEDSPSNTATAAQLVANAALEFHDTYKIKVSRSVKKLDTFFGEQTPLDVCIGEIVKEGLKAMLESKVPLCYFLYYLLDEFSSENLFFFLDVEYFERQYKKGKIEDQRAFAQRIFDRYIANNASLEINIDDRVKRNIIDQFISCNNGYGAMNQHVFSEAKISIYALLETSFHRFLHTRVYDDMVANCGELTIHYNEHVQSVALNYLIEYLRTQRDILLAQSESNSPLSDALVRLNFKHYEMVKNLVQAFIRHKFGVNYNMSSEVAALSVNTKSNAASIKTDKKEIGVWQI